MYPHLCRMLRLHKLYVYRHRVLNRPFHGIHTDKEVCLFPLHRFMALLYHIDFHKSR